MNRPSQLRPRVPVAGPGRQRGVSAVIAAILLVSVVTSFALAVDVTRLYFSEQELQRLADISALDAVQVASGCAPGSGGVAGSFAAVTAEASASLTRNASPEIAQQVSAPTVEVGRPSVAGGLQTFTPLAAGDSNIQAVRVTLSRNAPPRLLPFMTGGTAKVLSARSVAQQPVYASFQIGTTLLTLDTNASQGLNMLLGGLLGTNVNLNLVGYQGLLGARVSLANLMVAAGVSSLNDLLNLNTTLPQALQILGDALALGGDATSATAAGLVSGLAGQAYSGTTTTQNLIGQAINNAASGLSDPLSNTVANVPFVDGLALLTALGEAAGKGQTIQLPVTASVAGQELGVFVKVLEPAQVSNGPGRAGYDSSGQPYTTAKSSQVVLQIRLKTGLSLGILSIADIRLAIDLQAANGTSVLTRIDCPTLANPNATATIDTTASLLTAKVGTFNGSATAQPPQDPISGPVITAINLPGILKLSITTTVGQQTFGTNATQVGQAPFPDTLPTLSSGQNVSALVGSLLSSNLTVNLSLLGLPLPGINAGAILSGILTPITGLLDVVLDALLQALGIKVGEVGVTLHSITIQAPETITRSIN